MCGVGRCGGIEKTSLISLTSEERQTWQHMMPAWPRVERKPKRLETVEHSCNQNYPARRTRNVPHQCLWDGRIRQPTKHPAKLLPIELLELVVLNRLEDPCFGRPILNPDLGLAAGLQ